MDTSDRGIDFDIKGICNNCREYDEKIKKRVFLGKEGKRRLSEIIGRIKADGKGKKYDCIVGLSGGVDSTYVAYLAKKKWGLNPLAVHMDNGWNSKTASKNISRIVRNLEIDLFTYVINWEEFRDLQLAYLKASVIDIEAVTDYAIKAVLYNSANKHNIKYILSGVNLSTEGILPRSWRYNKGDTANLLDIHKRFGNVKLKTFPILTIPKRIYYQFFNQIGEVEVLNFMDYNKEDAKKTIKEELGWEDYGMKHGESVFTRFYQSYILPRKFGIDKRRAHLSTLICSGQMLREEALKKIKEPIDTKENIESEKEYIMKKLGLTEKEFDEIINSPVRSHYDYKSNDNVYKFLRKIYLNHIKK